MSDWQSFRGGREWRIIPQGIQSRGDDGHVELHRTLGEPWTMRLYLTYWGRHFTAAAEAHEVPVALLLHVVATENGRCIVDSGHPDVLPPRREPGYISDHETPHRISVGPCHLLISTAREAMGDPSIDRAWLQDVGNNLTAAAAYIARQKSKTGFDPIKVAAAYNAGGLYPALEGKWANRWHLKTYGNHLDRAASWYGDAVAVLEELTDIIDLDRRGLGRVAA